jgi:hypothetical protein
MAEAKQTRTTPYASGSDFCRIFDEDLNSLYQLSFLLTADREKAEQCFVSGLEDAVDGNSVFKDWARSWARRVIIQNAVRVIEPRQAEGSSPPRPVALNGNHKTPAPENQVELAAVLRLEPFERFVYVMSILESYRDQDCSMLLNCSRRDVIEGRDRALQQIGNATELSSEALREPRGSLLQLLIAPRLATSA